MESNFDSAKTLVERANELDNASIEVKKALRPQNVFRVTLDLSKARSIDQPFPINKAFKSVFVEKATDPRNTVLMRPTTDSSEQDFFALGYKDSWAVSTVVPKAFFHWEQQTGSVTLVFFTDAEFRSGSQVSLTSGGVSISEGSSFIPLAPLTLAATTITQVLPQNLFRKVATITNKTGADLWFGGPTVSNTGANEGFSIASGESLKWRNTAELYAYSVPGGKVVRSEQE